MWIFRHWALCSPDPFRCCKAPLPSFFPCWKTLSGNPWTRSRPLHLQALTKHAHLTGVLISYLSTSSRKGHGIEPGGHHYVKSLSVKPMYMGCLMVISRQLNALNWSWGDQLYILTLQSDRRSFSANAALHSTRKICQYRCLVCKAWDDLPKTGLFQTLRILDCAKLADNMIGNSNSQSPQNIQETNSCLCLYKYWHVDVSVEQNHLIRIKLQNSSCMYSTRTSYTKGKALAGIVNQQAAAVSGSWQAQSV